MRSSIKLVIATLAGVSAATIPARAAIDYTASIVVSKKSGMSDAPPYTMGPNCNFIFNAAPLAPELYLSEQRHTKNIPIIVKNMLSSALNRYPECLGRSRKTITAEAYGKTKPVGFYQGGGKEFSGKVYPARLLRFITRHSR